MWCSQWHISNFRYLIAVARWPEREQLGCGLMKSVHLYLSQRKALRKIKVLFTLTLVYGKR